MNDFSLPNYHGGSIVNLMSSVAGAFNVKMPYPELRILPSEHLRNIRNIVLIVIDGLGYEYLKDKEGILNENLAGKMTSVFLPTTASAITTFLTGVAPQQHAYTGWFMHLKEIGAVTTILPFSPRFGGDSLAKSGFKIQDFLNQKAFTSRIKASNFCINPGRIARSEFSSEMSKNSKILGYDNPDGFFRQIVKAVNSNKRRKYIYAYWPEFDKVNHKHGIGHNKSNAHFKRLEKKIRRLAASIRGTNTLLIVTADHGFINSSVERTIKLEDHPKLKACLTLPLCGEGRTAYCYVRPAKTHEFESYVRTRLANYCYMFKSQELIDKGYFGLFNVNPRLIDRIGDYVLIFKENYIIKDIVAKRKKEVHIGHHGGVSREEMIVPLVLINC